MSYLMVGISVWGKMNIFVNYLIMLVEKYYLSARERLRKDVLDLWKAGEANETKRLVLD